MWSFLKRYRTALVIFSFLVLGVISGPSLWRGFEKYKARTFCKKAHAALDAGDYQSAWVYGQKAYTLNSTSPEPNRVLGRLYAKIDPEQALFYWKKAVSLSQSKDDRKVLIELALDSNLLLTAFSELGELEKILPLEGDYFFLRGRYLHAQSRLDEALECLKQALNKDPKNMSYRLFYAALNFEASSPEARRVAIHTLFDLAEEEDSLQALRMLALRADLLDAEALQKLVFALSNAKAASLEDRFLSLYLQYNQGLLDEKSTLAQVQALVNFKNLDERLSFLRFLNSHAWYDLSLESLSLEDSLKSKDLFLVYIDALAGKNAWTELDTVFRSQTTLLPIENYLRWMFEARIYKEKGNDRRSQLAWDKALVEARGHRAKLWQLAEYALLMQDREKIRLTFTNLLRENPLSLQAYIRWLEWERQNGDTATVLRLLQKMQIHFPENLSIGNDLRYLELLLEQNLVENEAKAQLMLEQYPSVFAYRMTLALAYLKNEKPKQALELILDLGINWKGVDASYRVLAASILAANAYPSDAERMLERVELDSLLPEERLLLKE